MGITVYDFEGEYTYKAVETAYAYGLSMYDAAYVALALLYDATLHTADREVVAKISSPKLAKIGIRGMFYAATDLIPRVIIKYDETRVERYRNFILFSNSCL